MVSRVPPGVVQVTRDERGAANDANVRLPFGVVALVLSCAATARAADITVLSASASALVPITNELFPAFERQSGHKLAVRSAFGPVLNREIDDGAAFDVAILSLDIEGLVKSGKIAKGTRVFLGRTGIGVGVRKGAPRPDVSTPEAFRRTLLGAKSVAYSGDGSSGNYFVGVLKRLGIAEEMKARLRPQVSGNSPAKAVASGDVELAVTGVSILVAAPGVDYVGALPPELQSYVIFTAGVSATAKEPEAGRALLRFLTSPESVAAFKAKGLEPETP